MAQRDYSAYRNLYKAISSFLPPPDIIVYLQASVDTLLKHISKRGREFEKDIEADYIAQLNTLYDAWIDDWTVCPVLRVPMDTINFQENRADFETITRDLQARLPETTH
jgi:deoxyadenosine/deoxycytidine kinase